MQYTADSFELVPKPLRMSIAGEFQLNRDSYLISGPS